MHRLTEFSLKRPWLTLAILLAITVGLGLGVPKVKPGYGSRVLIGDQHPAIRNLDELVSQFSGGLPVQVAWECGPGHPCQSVFDETSLRMANGLTNELKVLPMVRAVESPSSAVLLVPAAQGFAVRRLVENGEIAPDAKPLSQRALKDRLWRNTLVSPDGRVGVILVQTTDNRPETDIAIVDAIDHALNEYRDKGFVFYMVGAENAPANVIGGRALSESMARTIPFLVLVIALILYFTTRSWQHTLTALVTMGVGLLWTFGVVGWLAWPQDGILEVLAPLILVVGVCDAVHVLARYAHSNAGAAPRTEMINRAAREAGPACLITTLTTAGAYLSFTTSALDTFVRFGVISAFGVVACLTLTFSLLPLLTTGLSAGTPRVEKASHAWREVMSAIVQTSRLRHTTLLAASALLFFFFGWGWTQLRVDQDWLESWGDNSEFVQSVRFTEDRVGLSQTLELDVSLPDDVDFQDPVTLQSVDALSQSLLRMPEFTQTTSVLTLMERLNRLLNHDDPAYERTGDSRAANAELLEILSFDDPENLGRWLSLDGSRFRLSFDSEWVTQSAREELLEQVQSIISTRLPPAWEVTVSGSLALGHDWVRDVQATQLRSFPVAFGIVFVLVSIFLRSWKLGLAAMVPSLLPVVVVLGAMGWLGMNLDVARTMIAAVVIGIGVDDAIHLLAHYKVRRDAGDDPHAAIAAALQHTGRAIVTTSVALALGFLTLMMSAWQTVASFGFFVAIAIMGALVATLFVLPALIFAFTKGQKADPT